MDDESTTVRYKSLVDEESIAGDFDIITSPSKEDNQSSTHSTKPQYDNTTIKELGAASKGKEQGGNTTNVMEEKMVKTTDSTEIKRLRELLARRDEEIDKLYRDKIETNGKIEELQSKIEKGIHNSGSLSGPITSFRSRFTRISTLSEMNTYSPSVTVAGVEWAILICANTVGSVKYLAVYLQLMSDCKKKSFSTSCTFKLLHHTEWSNVQSFENISFKQKNANYGFPKLIAFEDLIKTPNGYVKDDSIVIEVDLKICPSVECLSKVTIVPISEVQTSQSDKDSCSRIGFIVGFVVAIVVIFLCRQFLSSTTLTVMMEDMTSNVSYKRFADEESINGDIADNAEVSTPKESTANESSLSGDANDSKRDGRINQMTSAAASTKVMRLSDLIARRDIEIEELSRVNVQFETLESRMENNMIELNASSNSFRNRFTHISTLSDTPFYLLRATRICTTTIEAKKFLSVYLSLRTDQICGKPIAASCTVKLLRPNKLAKSESFEKIFFKLKNDSYGFQKFISFDELLKPSNGFVTDDSIEIEMVLKVDPSVEPSSMVDIPLTEERSTTEQAVTTPKSNTKKEVTFKMPKIKCTSTCFYGILIFIGAICVVIIAIFWIRDKKKKFENDSGLPNS